MINCPPALLLGMDEWCTKTHTASGLVDKVSASSITLEAAEEAVLQFVREYVPQERQLVLCGNSIHVDRLFLLRQMPRLIQHLHYRLVDVSTIKELARSWFPAQFANQPKKGLSHRALDDIRESITELRYYRANIFL